MSYQSDPIDKFRDWYHQAMHGISITPNLGDRFLYPFLKWGRFLMGKIYPPLVMHDPDAMVLSTMTNQGRPSARTVLFRGLIDDGFSFYTNYNSNKGKCIKTNPYVALTFHWVFPERQVRVEGSAKQMSRELSSSYWLSRPRGSQLSAIASDQSSVIPGREYLLERREMLYKQFQGQDIPCPKHWGGYLVFPEKIEFWQGRANRLHNRICYTKKEEGWDVVTLAP